MEFVEEQKALAPFEGGRHHLQMGAQEQVAPANESPQI